MYEAFYGFREKPFNLTPDPKYLYLSAKHSEAFAHLEFGLKERGGFVVITGEVGTGKTTLCRYFLDRLPENTVSAFILYPALSAVELLRSICEDLGIEEHGWSPKEWVDILHRFLLESRAQGKNIVLVIDEAQNLDITVLEQIRLISNLETTTEKLIQIVLIGQTELNNLLSRNDLRQLAQRVTARYHLRPLNREETTDYIRHRLGVVGGAGKVSFTPAALRAIHRFSEGIPRLINLVCDRALLAGFVTSRREIDRKVVRRAVRELEHIPGIPERHWFRSWRVRVGFAALILAALALSFRPEAQRFLPWNMDRERQDGDSSREGDDSNVTPAVEPPESDRSEGADASPASRDLISPEQFERRLRTLSRGLSRRGAAAAVLETWDISLSDVTAISPGESLTSIGGRVGLQVTEIPAHFEQLRKLNMPVILEFYHDSRNESCFAALLGLDEATALVSFSPGDAASVAITSLERFWVHQATFFWKDYEKLAGLAPGHTEVDSWVRVRLQELGYLSGDGEASEPELRSVLGRFQSACYLVADGVVGPRTRMALYSRSGRYAIPRLREP